MAWVERRGPWFRVRYRDAEGRVRSTPDKYTLKQDALDAADDMESDARHGRFIDPNAAHTKLATWVATWRTIHHVAPGTQAKNDSLIANHILPAFGEVSLDGITRLAVKRWTSELLTRRKISTVRSIVTLLSTILSAGAEHRMIAHNPIQGLRLDNYTPDGQFISTNPRPIPDTTHTPLIQRRVRELGGRTREIMMITAEWTGMRFGELGGLSRTNCHTKDQYLEIDPYEGVLHEVRGQLWLGPPKTRAGARRVDLPPFLCDLLDEVMDSHTHDQLFVGTDGGWLRRSHFSRRVWRPACDGYHDPHTGQDLPPILDGAVFHGLRHHHKTTLDELGVPEALTHERMGHHLKGIKGVYSHVTPRMRQHLINQLQQRWNKARRSRY